MNAKETIEQVLKLLETVDCFSNNKAVKTKNGEKVRKAYELLFNLKNEKIFKKT